MEDGYNLRNLITLEALDRMFAVVENGAAQLDPVGAQPAGNGNTGAPYVVDALPFVDFRGIAARANNRADYPGCGLTGADGGEIYYEVTLAAAQRIRLIALDSVAGVDVSVGVLDGAGTCLTQGNHAAHIDLLAGTHRVFLDSSAATAGTVVFGAVACDSVADPTCQ